MSQDALPGLLDLSAINEAYRADPDAPLSTLRAQCPVRRDEATSSVIVTRYDDVKTIVNDRSMLKHPVHANAASFYRMVGMRDDGRPVAQDTTDDTILFLDDPDHARIRGPLMQAFYKRASRMRGATERIVADVLDAVQDRQSFDVIADIGVPIPIYVIADCLGVERARLEEFRAWSEAIIHSLNPLRSPEENARVKWAVENLEAFFNAAMADRRAAPRDDLITDMVHLQAEGADLLDAEIAINLSALLVGGNLTTTDLIGNGVKLLLEHPEHLALLKADPTLAAATVEEILRFDSPVDFTVRVAPRDMEIGDGAVRQGDPIFTYVRAANRDPDVFSNPDSFDITRKHQPHVAFGGGPHICIGAPLARMEAQVALPMIFARFPNLRLAAQDFTWRTLPGFRGLERLLAAV